jgi:hypothetical protein
MKYNVGGDDILMLRCSCEVDCAHSEQRHGSIVLSL